MRRSPFVRWTLRTLATILLLLVIVVLLLETPWAHERARGFIEARANAALNGQIRIGGLAGSFWGHVTLSDVAVTQAGVPVMAVDRIEARYRPWQVFSTGTIGEVVLTKLKLNLVQSDTGWNIAGLVGPRSPEQPDSRPISIARLQVLDSVLDVRPRDGAVRRVADLNVLGSFDYQPRRIEVGIERATARDADSGVALRELRGRARFEEDAIRVDDLRVVTDGSRIAGDLETARSDSGRRIDVMLDAAPLSLPELARYVPQIAGSDIAPGIKLRARGVPEKFAVEFAVQSDAGHVNGRGEASVRTPEMHFNGFVETANLDLARWLGRPSLASGITAQANIDVRTTGEGLEHTTVGFDGQAADVTVGGYRAQTVRAKGKVRGSVVDVEATGTAYGSRVRTVARWSSGTLAARGSVARVDLRRLPRRLQAPGLATDLSGQYDLTYRPARWRADVTLDTSVIEGAAVAAGTTVHVERQPNDLSYRTQGAVNALDLDRIRPALEPYFEINPRVRRALSGRVTGRFDVESRGTTLDGTVARYELHLTESSIGGVQFGSLDAQASLDGRRLVGDARATVSQLSGEALGWRNGSQFVTDGTADVHVDVLDVLSPVLIQATNGRAVVSLTHATAMGTPVEAVQLDASLDSGIATVRTLELTSASLKASAAGTLAIDGEGQSDLKYDIIATDLAVLPPIGSRTLKGAAQVTGRITGPPTHPSTAGELQAHDLVVGSMRALSLGGRFEAAAPDFNFKQTEASFSGSGSFLEIGNTRIDRTDSTLRYSAGALDVETTIDQGARTLRFTGGLVPHPQHHEVHVRALAVSAGDALWQLPQGRDVVVQYATNSLSVRGLELVRNDSWIRIEGSVGTTATPTEPLSVVVERVRVEDINKILLGTHVMRGQLDATARVEGTLAEPRISVTGRVVGGEADGVAFESLTGRADYAAYGLSLDAQLEAGTSGRLKASGSMPIRFGPNAPGSAPPFNLRVESQNLNLALLQPLTTHLEAIKGTGNVDVNVSGPASKPLLAGGLALTNAAFRVAATGVMYPRLNARMSFEGERVTVTEFQIEDDDRHTATIQGGLSITTAGQLTGFDLSITAEDFHVLHNQFGELSLDLELRARGDLTAPLVTGTIKAERVRLEVDDLLERFSGGGYRSMPATSADVVANEAASKAAVPRPASAASYSITLDLPDNAVLRGRNLRTSRGAFGLGDINMTLGGALTIAKDSGAPVTLLGRLDVVRGQYSFQGRRFNIVRGSELQFFGDNALDPIVRVTAERQIGGVAAQVRVTGTARRPEVALSSIPPLDQGDILSLIVFNQTMNELQTGDRVALAGRAGTLAARALATPIADSVMRALDFDLFEIEPNDDSAATGATVTVGRQVGENLFVGFRQDLGADDVSQVSFEYRINQLLRVVTSFAQGADRSRSIPRAETAGIDLFFVIRR